MTRPEDAMVEALLTASRHVQDAVNVLLAGHDCTRLSVRVGYRQVCELWLESFVTVLHTIQYANVLCGVLS